MDWSEAFETGLSVIDAEHKHLIEFITLLGRADVGQRRRFTDKKLLEDLYTLTKIHFETEEDFMFKADFLLLDSHLGEHSTILGTLRTLIDAFAVDGDAQPVLDFMSRSIVDHIRGEDTALADFIRSKRQGKGKPDPATRGKGGVRKP